MLYCFSGVDAVTRDLLRKISVVLLWAALVALLFFVFIPFEADAETPPPEIPLTFDTVPPSDLIITKGSNAFLVKYFKGRLDDVGELVSLVDGGTHKVNAAKGYYYVDGSEVLVACDVNTGAEIPEGPVYEGRVCFHVEGRSLWTPLAAETLTKMYGDDSRSTIVWEKVENENTIVVTYESNGFAATAVPKTYPLSVKSVTSNGIDVKDEYTVTPKVAGTNVTAELTVTAKPLNVSFAEEQTVFFNNFILSGETESVVSVETAGVNEEVVTTYFRLTEADRGKTVLTVGEQYAVEYCKHTVRDGEGADVPSSYYAVTADLTEISTVRAVSGPIKLYQGDIPAYAGRADCVRLDIADFTFTYLDDLVSDYNGSILFENVELYPGIVVDLRCSVARDAGAIPASDTPYALTLLGVEQEGFDEVTMDAAFSMVVLPRVLSYDNTDDCQYGYKSFQKEVKVSIPDREGEYTFALSASISEGLAVNETATYTDTTAVSKEDQSVWLDYSAARVRIVRRSDGVAFRAADDLSAVYYHAAYTVSTLALTENGKTSTLAAESENILLSYSINGETYTDGSPTVVGTYKVKCTLKPESSYMAEPAVFDLVIVPCPVLAVYRMETTSKRYGETFRFASDTMLLTNLYFYNMASGTPDRSLDYAARPYEESVSAFSGISCEGVAVGAELGSYPVTVSVTAGNFDVKAILIYDKSTKQETNVLTVVQGVRPPNTSVTVKVGTGKNDRVIDVTVAAAPALVQISEKADFSAKNELSTTDGKASFKNRKYGQIYYVRACLTDSVHYENEKGEWSEVKSVSVALPALTVALVEDSVTDTTAAFTATALSNAASYVVEYKVGSTGRWTEGSATTELTAGGLAPGVMQTVYFRARSASVAGKESSVSVTTLFAPVKEDAVSVAYDRETGELTVTADAAVEMRLLSKSGEVITDWTSANVFADVPHDAEYILQVRNAADGERSAITEIETDTYRKGPLSILTYLADWFLVWIGALMVVALIVIIILFVRVKRNMDRRLLGGKDEK